MANREFEEKREAFEERLIDLCKQVVGEKMSMVDKLYIYCCSERVVSSFDFFTVCAKRIRDRGHLGIEDTDFFDIAFEEIELLKELCKEYGEKRPEAVKIIYDVVEEEKEVIYIDKPMGSGLFKVSTAVSVEGDRMWFATEKGYIYGLDRFTGEEAAKKKKGAAGAKWIGFYEDGLLVLSDKGQIEYYQKC